MMSTADHPSARPRPRFVGDHPSIEEFRHRVKELESLLDGWLDGRGMAPPAAGLGWVDISLRSLGDSRLPMPFLYPTAEGGVRAEWMMGRIDVSLELDLTTRIGDWHTLDLDSDEENAQILDLNEVSGWQSITDQLKAMQVAKP